MHTRNSGTQGNLMEHFGTWLDRVRELQHTFLQRNGHRLNHSPITTTKTHEKLAQVPSKEAALVTSETRHTPQMEARHYRAIVDRSHAASIFKHMEEWAPKQRPGEPAKE